VRTDEQIAGLLDILAFTANAVVSQLLGNLDKDLNEDKKFWDKLAADVKLRWSLATEE